MRAICFAAAVAAITGCQSTQLRNHTSRQAASLTDLQYQQVLNNIAMFASAPDSVPFFSVAGTGRTSVLVALNAQGTTNWSLLSAAGTATNWFFDRVSSTGQATNTTGEEWATASILSPEKLLLMQQAFQRTVGRASPESDAKLRKFFRNEERWLQAMQPGWYCVGRKKDIPKNACYVGLHKGCCGDTYVWVTPDHHQHLADLTIAVLDIATIELSAIGGRGDHRAKLMSEAKALTELMSKTADPNAHWYVLASNRMNVIMRDLYNDNGTQKDSPTIQAASSPVDEPVRRENFFNPLLLPPQQ